MNHSTIAVLLDLFILITIPVLASTSTSPSGGVIVPGERQVLVASRDIEDSAELERTWQEQIASAEVEAHSDLNQLRELATAQQQVRDLKQSVQRKEEQLSVSQQQILDAENNLAAEKTQNAVHIAQIILDRTVDAMRREKEHRSELAEEKRKGDLRVDEEKRKRIQLVRDAKADAKEKTKKREDSVAKRIESLIDSSMRTRDAIADLTRQKMPKLSVDLEEEDRFINDEINTKFSGFLAEQADGEIMLLAVGSQLCLLETDGIGGGPLDLLKYSGTVEYRPEHVRGLEQPGSLNLSEIAPLFDDPRVVILRENGSSIRWTAGLKIAGRRFFNALPVGHPEELILVGTDRSAVVKYRRHQDSSFADMYLCILPADDDMYKDPKEGDILMTKDGKLVGVMISEMMAFVLPENIVARDKPHIPFGEGEEKSLKTAAKNIQRYQQAVSDECSQIPDCD